MDGKYLNQCLAREKTSQGLKKGLANRNGFLCIPLRK